MKVIFSFKFIHSFNSYREQRFYNYARLAVASASRFHSTHLYCDKRGEEFFRVANITFDKVTILDEIEQYDGGVFSMCKIFAMIHEKEPYVHLDFDTYTNAPYSTNELVGFAYPEVDLKNQKFDLETFDYLNKAYLNPYRERIQGKIFDILEPTFDWRVIPNNSAIIVNSPELVASIYKTIIKKYKQVIDTKIEFSAMFIEQFLLARYLDYYKVKYSFIYGKDPVKLKSSSTYEIFDREVTIVGVNEKKFLMNTLKFAHFSGYRKFPHFSQVVDELYEHCVPKKPII
jgi:hypothetical protein